VSVLNLSDVVDKADPTSSTNSGVHGYFHALCHQPVPGPLVGGSAASKDVNKWLDKMIAWYESSASDFQRGDTRKLLISLLKILCQHYGKLRSPFGSDPQEVLSLLLSFIAVTIFKYVCLLISSLFPFTTIFC
jgi:COPII coat assembly protein SEC16